MKVQNDENINNDNAVYRNGMATQSSQLKLAVHTSNGMVTHRNVMQRIDGNIRWYVCLYCPKEFRRPSDLVRHIRIHTKEKVRVPYITMYILLHYIFFFNFKAILLSS